jgi:hypothetical protein
VDALAENRGWVEAKLEEHGALLLRGFSAIQKASDFNAVVEACAWAELPYVGGAAPRTNVCGRVFTSNESPPDQKIPFHHEMAQVSPLRAQKNAHLFVFFLLFSPPLYGQICGACFSHKNRRDVFPFLVPFSRCHQPFIEIESEKFTTG